MTANVPRFQEVLVAILSEMVVQCAVIAEEMAPNNPAVHAELCQQLGKIPVSTTTHQDFRVATKAARAMARSGEFSPYANVILRAGVAF